MYYSSIDRSTVRRSIARYQTFDRLPFRWFNKSRDLDVSYVYLQYRRAVMALSKFSDCWMNTIMSNLHTSNRWRQFWKKIMCIANQLWTGFWDNSFVWPSNGSVAVSLRRPGSYSCSGQTKLPLSSNPVKNYKVYRLLRCFEPT